MPTVFLAPAPLNVTQFIPGGNTPANGAQLFSYVTHSSTKQNIYTTSTGAVAWANPLVLDSGGNIPGGGEIWIPQQLPARFILAPSNDTDPPGSPYWTRDDISGVNDAASLTSSEWIVFAGTPTGAGANSFTLAGDQTGIFTTGIRVKIIAGAQTLFGTVLTSVFAAVTTVTISVDTNVSIIGITSVSYSIHGTPNGAIPWATIRTTGIDFYSGVGISTTNASVTTGSLVVVSTSNFIGGLTASTATINSAFTAASSASFKGTLLGFYNVAVTTQANVGIAVSTSAPTSTAPFGYSSSAQALDIITKLNNVISALKQYGLSV